MRHKSSRKCFTVFLLSNERVRPASTVQSMAIVAPDHRLLHEKCGLLSGRTVQYDRHRGWTALEKDCTMALAGTAGLALKAMVLHGLESV